MASTTWTRDERREQKKKPYWIVRVYVGKNGPTSLESRHELALIETVCLDDLDPRGGEGLGRFRFWVAGDATNLEGPGLIAEQSLDNAAALGTGCTENGDELGGHREGFGGWRDGSTKGLQCRLDVLLRKASGWISKYQDTRSFCIGCDARYDNECHCDGCSRPFYIFCDGHLSLCMILEGYLGLVLVMGHLARRSIMMTILMKCSHNRGLQRWTRTRNVMSDQ